MVQRAGGLEYAVDQVFFFKKKLFGVSVSVSVPVSVSVSVHYVCVEVVEGRKTKVGGVDWSMVGSGGSGRDS